MADYYMEFSEAIEITPEAADWVKMFLKEEAPAEPEAFAKWLEDRGLNDDAEVDSYPQFEWSIKTESDGSKSLWLHSDAGGFDEDHLVGFVQELLIRFFPDKVVTITTSSTCSKPRLGAFGGVWFAISARTVLWGDTWGAASKAAEKLKPRKKGKQK